MSETNSKLVKERLRYITKGYDSDFDDDNLPKGLLIGYDYSPFQPNDVGHPRAGVFKGMSILLEERGFGDVSQLASARRVQGL